MDSIHIHGGIPLQGQVTIQGSKNAALPVLAATILTKDTSVIHNCPRIADVYHMQALLDSLGCKVCREEKNLKIDASQVYQNVMPKEAITGMRSSVVLLGALLGRCREVTMEYPGGCVIGERPIDMHIGALRAMNVVFRETSQGMHAFTSGLKGADIAFHCSSVGATENVILAAVLAEGTTTIRGAAREPEIVALCEYLNKCGAAISGYHTGMIRIEGVKSLHGASYRIPSDRIVAGTYLFGCLAAGGNVFLRDAPAQQMCSVIFRAGQMGAMCQEAPDGIYVQSPERLRALPAVRTEVYPGFPTDLQSPLVAVLATADGVSCVEESIFEDRFRIVPYLQLMGADITVRGRRCACVTGVDTLAGAAVCAEELRGGAALAVAGLGALGETVIGGCEFINRGYENICRDLRELGARIYSV